MKKIIAILTALALMAGLCAAWAEDASAASLDAETAEEIYQEYLGRIVDPEDEIHYMIGTAEYGPMEPAGVDPSEYVKLLQQVKLEAADITEAPDGEFVFLYIPDHCQIDFFLGEQEKNYVRVTLFGDQDASALLQGTLPEDIYMPVSGMAQFWANDLADANGILGVDETVDMPELPEEGWVAEAVTGDVWQYGRASMEVIPEGDGFKVLILWGSSAWETTEWTYACDYIEETQTLKAVHLICDDIVFDDLGNETRNNVTDEDCETEFALNEEGKVVIRNAADDRLEGAEFEKIREVSGQYEGLYADIQKETDSPEWIANLPAAKDATQLFVVAGIGMDRTTAFISMHQKDAEGNWKQILSTPGFVGKNGLCADEDHKEGCAQTPIGVYRFNRAFGIAADPGCAIPYFQVDENTYWSGDPDRQYNQMVDIREVPELAMDDSEHIVDYEYQYRYCLNISFNEDGTPGRGSAIFLHCLGPAKPWTGGCVAVPENIMKLIMENVQEDCVVVIDTLENMGGTL